MGWVRTQNDSSFSGGKDMVSTEVSKFAGNADSFAESVHSSTGWLQLAQGSWALETVCKNLGQALSRRSQCGNAVEMHQQVRGPKERPACWWGCSLLMALPGVDWWWWLRLASIGVEWWSWLRMATNEREEEREGFGEHVVPCSLFQIRNASDLMSSWYSAGHGWSKPYYSENGRRRGSWEKVLRGRMVLPDVQYGMLEPRL